MSQENTTTQTAETTLDTVETAAVETQEQSAFDVDSLSVEELREYQLTGKPPETAAAPAVETPDVEPAEESAEKVAAKETAEASVEADDDIVNSFTFTEDADAETLAAEEAAYLARVELPAPVQAMLDRRDAQLAALQTQIAPLESLGDLETVRRTVGAFDRLVEFRQTEDGTFIPDTSGVREILQQEYPQEYVQLVEDVLSEPSTKYPNHTRLQEFMRDYGNLDERGIQTIDYILHNDGRLPLPSFVPQGIDEKVAEAFWTSPRRDELQSSLESHLWTIHSDESSSTDKESAKRAIQTINQELAQIQNGLNAERRQQEFLKNQQSQAQAAIETKAAESFKETTVGLLRQFGSKTAKSLTMFEGQGAEITGLSYATLVEKALSDNDYAKYAQEDLSKRGVSFDWKKGRETLDRLWTVENKIAQQTAQNANPRAVEISKREKDGILRELNSLQTELLGKITKIAVSGSTKALEKKIAGAPKIPAGKAKVSAATTTAKPTPNFNEMSVQELRQTLRDPLHAAAFKGDLSGFES